MVREPTELKDEAGKKQSETHVRTNRLPDER